MNPTLELALKRTAQMCGIFMVGNGIVGLAVPERQAALWRSDVKALDRISGRFDGEPGKRRLNGLAQLAAGLLIATQMRRPDRA
jgi:hypothetical protein